MFFKYKFSIYLEKNISVFLLFKEAIDTIFLASFVYNHLDMINAHLEYNECKCNINRQRDEQKDRYINSQIYKQLDR